MATIVTRAGLGSPLSNNQVDSNFNNLNTDKAELSGATFTGAITANGGIALGDNDNATFGAGDDLEIYSDGTNGVLKNTNGNYILLDSDNLAIRSQAGSNRVIVNSSGIDVTGTATMDGLNVSTGIYNINTSGASLISSTGSVKIDIDSDNNATDNRFLITSDGNTKNRLEVGEDGDISFYEDTGTTPKFFWDASTERLGLGVTNPSMPLHLYTASSDIARFDSTSTTSNVYIATTNAATGNKSALYFAPSNSVAGAYVLSEAVEDFTTSANRSAKLVFGTRNNGSWGERLTINADGSSVFSGSVTADGLTSSGTLTQYNTYNSASSQIGTNLVTDNGSTSYMHPYIDMRRWTGAGTNHYTASIELAPSTSDGNAIVFMSDSKSTSTKATTERLRIDSSGRVGIGTSSPTEKLHVEGNVRLADAGSIQFGSSKYQTLTGQAGSNDLLYRTYANHIFKTTTGPNNNTDGSERMRIDSSGHLLLGTSGSFGALGTLVVQQTADSKGIALIDSAAANTFFIENQGDEVKFRLNATSPFTFTHNSTERMRIDSSGRVGIGTSSPSAKLSVSNNGAGGLEFTPSYSGTRNLILNYNRSTSAYTGVDFDATDYIFYGSGTERMRIDASGNVGIGEALPLGTLHVKSADSGASVNGSGNELVIENSGSTGLSILSGITGDGNIFFGDSGGSVQGKLSYSHNGDYLSLLSAGASIFYNGGTERMRIDSSGNLLVGTTSATGRTDASSGEGIALSAGSYGGFIGATRSGANPLALNRLSTDGAIATFAKDGTNVGSIGTQGGDLNIGTGACGISFVDGVPALYPWTTTGNATRDAAIDLGDSGARFKDLYLSGGVYLGGTGSANKLTDYEEGTWTPTGFSGGTLYNARYTKVGRLVTVSAYVNGTTFTSASMGGLPFTSEQGWSAGTLGLNDSTNINSCEVASASTVIQFRQGATSVVPNGSGLMVSVTYHAA